MSIQTKIQHILHDLTHAEDDLAALIAQANQEPGLTAQQINGLMGMQDTLAFYKNQLANLNAGQAMNDDLIAIIESFAQRLKSLASR